MLRLHPHPGPVVLHQLHHGNRRPEGHLHDPHPTGVRRGHLRPVGVHCGVVPELARRVRRVAHHRGRPAEEGDDGASAAQVKVLHQPVQQRVIFGGNFFFENGFF